MPNVRYITSESQIGAPGVYVQELAPAVPIRGQRRRVIGLVGQCVRGPGDKLVVCDSYKRFTDVFGERDRATNGGTILGHIWKFLQGKRWGKLIVGRVVADDAVKASFTLETAAGGGGTQVARIDASWFGASGNDVKWKVSAASNGDANAFNLTAKLYGKLQTFQNIKITTGFDNTNQVIGNDDATWIRVTKLADGRPVNSAASTDGADTSGFTNLGQTVGLFVSVAGTDGTIADTDYTVADGPMDKINARRGVHACAVVGNMSADIKTAVETYAATATQRVWFVCPDDETVTYSDAITERAGINSDRVCYAFNHVTITDPVTAEAIVEEPFGIILSIISQTDPDNHPGDFSNVVYTKAARDVTFELGDSVRDALDAGGVTFIHRDLDQDGNEVIIPGNALTCDFSNNNRDLDGRYMKDFLIDGIANRMKGDQFVGNTNSARVERAGAVSGFLDNLARNDRYVLRDENGTPQYSYVNGSTVNVAADQATGLQKDRAIITLIPKNKVILFQPTIGTDAVVSDQ